MAGLEDIANISGIGNYSPGGGEITPFSSPYGKVISFAPDYQFFTAPLSNKGNPTSPYGNNSIAVSVDTPIRLVDLAKNQVVFEGKGYDAAKTAIAMAQDLTKAGGNKANWNLQVVPPGSTGYQTIANEKVNNSVLGAMADIVGDAALGFLIGGPVGAAVAAGASAAGVNVSNIAYPVIGAMTGLGPIAGAAAGSAFSSTIQGDSLKQTLMKAGITALTAGILEGTGLGNKISDAVSGVMKDVGFKPVIDDVFKNISSGAISKQVGDEIIVNAIMKEAATAGISGGVTSLADYIAQKYPGYQLDPNARTLLTEADPNAASSLLVTGTGTGAGGSTIAGIAGSTTTAGDTKNTTNQDKSGDGSAVTVTGTTTGGGTGTISGITGATTTTGGTKDTTKSDNNDGKDLTVTATKGAGTATTASLVDAALNIDPAVQKAIDNELAKDPNNKGLTTADLIRLGLLTPTLIASLLGGKSDSTFVDIGGSGKGVEIVPLNRKQNTTTGAVSGLGAYGFNPFTYGQATGNQPGEYVFFDKSTLPGFGGIGDLTTGTTMATTGGTKATTTTGTTGTTTTGGTTTGGTTTTGTTGTRPPGFTGVVSNQKIGDTQVVDGKTYVWGGDDNGWQFLATDNNGKQVLMPTGATNITSIADAFKSGVYRPSNEAEMARMREIDSIMAAADNAKTAAEANKILPGVYFDIDAATARAINRPELVGTQMSQRELQDAKLAADAAARARTAAQIPTQIKAAQSTLAPGTTAQSYYMDYVTPLAGSYYSTGQFDAAKARGLQQAVEPFVGKNDLAGAQGAVTSYLSSLGISAPPMAEGGEVGGDEYDGDDMVAHLIAYHKHGGHQGPGRVRGIGGGQEDKIPAWLSDGEYVWSAQDVAMLGGGSTEDGSNKLDKMRQMVRRRAGFKDVKNIAKPPHGIEEMLNAVGVRV